MNNLKNPKLRLLVFIYSMGDGGAERVTANLCNYWAELGWEIALVTLAPIEKDLFALHPAIQRIALDMAHDSKNKWMGLWHNLVRIHAFRRILTQFQPDIALSMMTAANVILALASVGLPKIKTIGSEHTSPLNTFQTNTSLWITLRKYVYRLLDALTTMSHDGNLWFQTNTYAKNILSIPNPVVWPLPLLEPKLVPPPQNSRRILLTAGRFVEVKGFDRLLEAFFELHAQHPDWDLIILGDGPLRPVFEKAINQKGLQKRIFLPGRSGNIGEWYARADLFALTSRYEGFPGVLVEALASGLPVVSFDCNSGPRDIIRHEVDGLLVEQGDLTGLILALDRLMSDESLRKKYAEYAIEARERYSLAKIATQWEQLFIALRRG